MDNTEWTFIYPNNWWKCSILEHNFRNIQITQRAVVAMGTQHMCLSILLGDIITQRWVRILIAGKPAAFSLQRALVLDYVATVCSVNDEAQDHPQSINVSCNLWGQIKSLRSRTEAGSLVSVGMPTELVNSRYGGKDVRKQEKCIQKMEVWAVHISIALHLPLPLPCVLLGSHTWFLRDLLCGAEWWEA